MVKINKEESRFTHNVARWTAYRFHNKLQNYEISSSLCGDDNGDDGESLELPSNIKQTPQKYQQAFLIVH